jgi:hypothetical protein
MLDVLFRPLDGLCPTNEDVPNTLIAIANVQEHQGNARQALETWRQAYALSERMPMHLPTEWLLYRKAGYATENETFEIWLKKPRHKKYFHPYDKKP